MAVKKVSADPIDIGLSILADQTDESATAWVEYTDPARPPAIEGLFFKLRWCPRVAFQEIVDYSERPNRVIEDLKSTFHKVRNGFRDKTASAAMEDKFLDAALAQLDSKSNETETDPEKEAEKIAEYIVGWKGMTVEALQKFHPVDLSKVDDPTRLVTFDPKLVEALLLRSRGLQGWVVKKITDVSVFGIAPKEAATRSGN